MSQQAKPTVKYVVKIGLSDTLRTVVQEIQAVATVIGMNESGIVAEIVTDDRYNLGVIVTDLQHTLNTLDPGYIVGMPKETA